MILRDLNDASTCVHSLVAPERRTMTRDYRLSIAESETSDEEPRAYNLRLSLPSNPKLRILATAVALCLFNIMKSSTRISHLLIAEESSWVPAAEELSPVLFRHQPVMIHLNGTSVKHVRIKDEPSYQIHDHYWSGRGRWLPANVSKHKYKGKTKGCTPLGDWYDDHHPSCNLFHEIDLNVFSEEQKEQVRLVGIGNIRTAWMVREYDGKKRVLKTMRYTKGLTNSVFEDQRIDAVVMEQLTSSPHIADIYGYCSTAAIVDFADGGDLDKFIRKNRTKNESLKVAHDVAAAVADLQHVGTMTVKSELSECINLWLTFSSSQNAGGLYGATDHCAQGSQANSIHFD